MFPDRDAVIRSIACFEPIGFLGRDAFYTRKPIIGYNVAILMHP